MLYRRVPRYIAGVLLSYACLCNGCQQSGLTIGGEDVAQANQDTRTSAILKSPGTELVATSASDTSPEDKQITVAKRPATEQPDEEASSTDIKRAKKEAVLHGHKEWFAAFAQALSRIEENSSDKEALDTMGHIFYEGRERNFLTQTIIYPSDGNPNFEYEYTPLHYVAAKGILFLVKELIEYENVPVDIQTKNYKNTALHLAASRGHLDVVEFLLERGANPELLDHRGGGVLHYAATGDNGEMARDIIHCLIKKGANFKKTVRSGSSMLDTAVMFCNIPVIEYWEDVYKNSSDPDVDVMTKGALAFAKYRFKKHPEEQSFLGDIIKILKGVMQYRQKKKHADNVGN